MNLAHLGRDIGAIEGVAMSHIPLKFSPPADELVEAGYLVKGDRGDAVEVTWPLLGIIIFVKESYGYPSFESVKSLNNNVAIYGDYGYSVGQFHEIFLGVVPAYVAFKLGEVEVTIGQATPLGVYLFDNQHDHKFWGEWSNVASARIYGCSVEQAETYLINALIRYHEKTGVLLSPVELNYNHYDELEVNPQGTYVFPPVSAEIEPTRFFYNGLLHADDASACLYFYRVLEFFAFLSYQGELVKLRHDSSVSDRDFLQKATAIISREEKGPLIKLIAGVATKTELDAAFQAKLIESKDAGLLGVKLYEFRNSVVHAKYDQKATIFSTSILAKDINAGEWRLIFQKLAFNALNDLGRKL